jgi:hypothetical protein
MCDGLIPRPRKKTIIQKEEEKTERINTMNINSKQFTDEKRPSAVEVEGTSAGFFQNDIKLILVERRKSPLK